MMDFVLTMMNPCQLLSPHSSWPLFVLAHFLWNVGAQAGEDRVFLVDLAADMVTQIAPEDVDNDTWR